MSVLDLKKKYMTTNTYIEIEEIRPKYKNSKHGDNMESRVMIMLWNATTSLPLIESGWVIE